MPSNADWLEQIQRFGIRLGLERMHALMEELGRPERRFRAIHVVGTNGKTSVTRSAEALLLAEGLSVGAYTSPHIRGWAERIRVDGAEVDIERALARVRPAAEALAATQFEVLTAAALAQFGEADVDVAVVEAGLGGRLDATNVLDAPVVVLTNVALEHTEHLGPSRETIAREKLAVVGEGATVVLGESQWEPLARELGAGRVLQRSQSNVGLAHAAVEELLDRTVDPAPAEAVQLPGRLERRGDAPLEIWDGAHNPAGVGYLLARLPGGDDWTLVLSIVADKDVEAMLAAFSALGRRVIATDSGYPGALPAEELAERARRFFPEVVAVPDPHAAAEHARAAAGPDGAVLVAGSLYLLAALAAVRPANVR